MASMRSNHAANQAIRNLKSIATVAALWLVMVPSGAHTAEHHQVCSFTYNGDLICLSNESWTGGFRAFDILAHETYGSSLPLWRGATTVLINPNFEPYTGEAIRDRFNSDWTINENNYANYTVGTCDPLTNATTGTHTIYYRAAGFWQWGMVPPVSGEMYYGFDGFWFTDFLHPAQFSTTEFHFQTNLYGHSCWVGIGNTTWAVDLSNAQAEDHTVYGW